MAITFRSPVLQPLHRGGCTPASDDFCITQRFGDPDFYWSNLPNPPSPLPTHRAVDIGNFRCGYPIVAMAAGTVRRVQDNATSFGAATNALGIEIDHGEGIKTAYWHLASWTAAQGATVQAGQEVGKLGATGLGATCHTHITCTVDGALVDPEPLMFGGTLGSTGGDNPVYNPKDLLDLYGLQAVVRASGANLREKQGVSYAILTLLPAATKVTLLARVVGEPVNGNIEWYETKAELGTPNGQQIMTGFIHSSAVDVVPVPIPPPPDCTALENKLRNAKTAVAGASQAVQAAERALA